MREVITFILCLDSSFVISGSTADSKKICVVVSCILHKSPFFDSLSSDNTACFRCTASKNEVHSRGRDTQGEPKKELGLEAWV